MSETNREIFEQFAKQIVPELQAVSKGFAPSISYEVTDNSLIITASPYIRVLIDGRAPTRSGAKRGNPTLQEAILAWINRHSITPRANKDGKVPTQEQLSWMISKSIHKYGTKLYQDIQNGAPPNNIFDTIITVDRIENLVNLMANKFYTEIKTINL
jgi:hypothetical protein